VMRTGRRRRGGDVGFVEFFDGKTGPSRRVGPADDERFRWEGALPIKPRTEKRGARSVRGGGRDGSTAASAPARAHTRGSACGGKRKSGNHMPRSANGR